MKLRNKHTGEVFDAGLRYPLGHPNNPDTNDFQDFARWQWFRMPKPDYPVPCLVIFETCVLFTKAHRPRNYTDATVIQGILNGDESVVSEQRLGPLGWAHDTSAVMDWELVQADDEERRALAEAGYLFDE